MKAFFLTLCLLTCATTMGMAFALGLLGLVHLASLAIAACTVSAIIGLFLS
jgi:hypothetical protein